MISCPFRLPEFGIISESTYSAEAANVRFNEAQIADIAGKRRKGLY